eukprot:5227770-Pyramimonas_sp.AAC.1
MAIFSGAFASAARVRTCSRMFLTPTPVRRRRLRVCCRLRLLVDLLYLPCHQQRRCFEVFPEAATLRSGDS